MAIGRMNILVDVWEPGEPAPAVLAALEQVQPLVAAVWARSGTYRSVLVVTPTAGEAERIARDARVWLGSVVVGGQRAAAAGAGREGNAEPAGHTSTTGPASTAGVARGDRKDRRQVRVMEFPAWDTLPFERVSPRVESMGERVRVLHALQDGGSAEPSDGGRLMVVASVRAVLQRLCPGQPSAPVGIAVGDTVDLSGLAAELSRMGYRREYMAEHRGEYAVRGGILDIYPSTSDMPVRVDLLGDEIESVFELDPVDQRSKREIGRVEVFPAREFLPTPEVRAMAAELVAELPGAAGPLEKIAEGQLFDGMETFMPVLVGQERLIADLLGEDSLVVLADPGRIEARSEELASDEAALAAALAPTWGIGAVEPIGKASAGGEPASGGGGDPPADAGGDPASGLPRLHLDHQRMLARTPAHACALVSVSTGPAVPTVEASQVDLPRADPEALVSRLASHVAEGWRVVVAAQGEGSAERLSERLMDLRPRSIEPASPVMDLLDGDPGLAIAVAPLEQGFVMPGQRTMVIAEPDLTGHRPFRRPARNRGRRGTGRPSAARDSGETTFFDDLAPGSYVVHSDYGVARYEGMVVRTMAGSTRDYLLLAFRGSDRLYLPTDQIDMLTAYSGGETPTLSKLGGGDWQKTRSRARAAVHELARDLVELYRERSQVAGHAFSEDGPWQGELEDSFPYVMTPGQAGAIAAVKEDMESERPMDRLVCGDVGFGKTEVAVQAVFKAVVEGRQAAVLAPTTLLAQQHTQTFAERLSGFPVTIGTLSRFTPPAEARRLAQELAAGKVDVVIGTHRILQEAVRFKNLGLIVVDEEHRFGVNHKEALKHLFVGVDVLTLTANPIPRTLEMALTGIRELSVIDTPPEERQPILTFVGKYDEAAVVEAVRREMLREGLVFYVHNHVADIERVGARLSELVPSARVAVAHGQMEEGRLERIMMDVWERRYDVLVATTIIEAGIDVPSASTLVVDTAHRLGLGQLHQLRGRVGRAGQRAYAYFMYPPGRTLTEAAYERLRTIGENTELGAGFKIAMRDLEIRGAGNLLGRSQSGHMAAVGYDLYVQMVAEEVAELKGERMPEPPRVAIDLPVKAALPADYVEREDLRLEAYRLLATASAAEEVDEVRDSLVDRFGPLPALAAELVNIAQLRVLCIERGVTDVSAGPERYGGRREVEITPVRLPASAQVRLRRLHPHAIYVEHAARLVLRLDSEEQQRPVDIVSAALRDLMPAVPPV